MSFSAIGGKCAVRQALAGLPYIAVASARCLRHQYRVPPSRRLPTEISLWCTLRQFECHRIFAPASPLGDEGYLDLAGFILEEHEWHQAATEIVRTRS